MGLVSFIFDLRSVKRILRHRKAKRSSAQDPFEPGPLPAAAAESPLVPNMALAG